MNIPASYQQQQLQQQQQLLHQLQQQQRLTPQTQDAQLHHLLNVNSSTVYMNNNITQQSNQAHGQHQPLTQQQLQQLQLQHQLQQQQQQHQLQQQQQQPPQITTSNTTGSPSLQPQQVFSTPLDPSLANLKYWKQQVQLAQVSRQSGLGHHYARAAAASSKSPAATINGTPNGTSTNGNNVHNASSPATVADFAMQLVDKELEEQILRTTVKNNSSRFDKSKKQDPLNQEKELIHNENVKKQFWVGLDLSGQGLLGLSKPLFNYDFLHKLYLNHNKLTIIPAAIKQLRHLRILDLSNNYISSLPSEMGMLSHLRYLFLFDNNIESLPTSFGLLYQLEIIGLEGNPLNDHIKTLLATEGTKSVIMELREKSPPPPIQPSREMIILEEECNKHKKNVIDISGAIIDGKDSLVSTISEPNADNTTKPELDGSDNNGDRSREEKSEETDPNAFTVMSYNTLCDRYATPQMYGYVPSWALTWDSRKETLMNEVLTYNADILCFQEVDGSSFEEFWVPKLKEVGYSGLHYPKTRSKTMGTDSKFVDGCAIFYRNSIFTLLKRETMEFNALASNNKDFKKSADTYNRVLNKENIAVTAFLEHKQTGQRCLVANTHLHWDPAYNDVKLIQVALLLHEIKQLAHKYIKILPTNNSSSSSNSTNYNDIKKLPIIICGDFNSTPDSGVYQLFSQGKANNHSDMEGRYYGKFGEEEIEHPFSLKSAYANIGELPFTNFTPGFTGVIDYIWYSSNTFNVQSLLGDINEQYLTNYVGFPNIHFPSDHISLFAKFAFKECKDGLGSKNSKFHAVPDFSSSSQNGNGNNYNGYSGNNYSHHHNNNINNHHTNNNNHYKSNYR
ncbi:hypothetical protein NADFUDRAFT_83730 [Nadsonia fulvescens var. elongata DSM 6958]|uniref:CCR4-Not complex 3'-5'-exoribonuclease subunit Ccr4 n=1 Tax=Nadsonia fulvescens var. elongata DSM 6958 TaxID=857566 RepID=A0A1E3PFL5_9ASCO|nr:hypothetical protein NADFUDRAFT_83730 [Nadsonia fulvescens var. elongata DSM 6958]